MWLRTWYNSSGYRLHGRILNRRGHYINIAYYSCRLWEMCCRHKIWAHGSSVVRVTRRMMLSPFIPTTPTANKLFFLSGPSTTIPIPVNFHFTDVSLTVHRNSVWTRKTNWMSIYCKSTIYFVDTTIWYIYLTSM